jgi:hypothetical protein
MRRVDKVVVLLSCAANHIEEVLHKGCQTDVHCIKVDEHVHRADAWDGYRSVMTMSIVQRRAKCKTNHATGRVIESDLDDLTGFDSMDKLLRYHIDLTRQKLQQHRCAWVVKCFVVDQPLRGVSSEHSHLCRSAYPSIDFAKTHVDVHISAVDAWLPGLVKSIISLNTAACG